jgi:cell fate (sporulation/competence/biofilm development) regulator YlbF (YheA/YmcA/DUF963 family)
MSDAIINKARELGLELSQSKEFINVREAEAKMMQNPESLIIIQEFQNRQHTLQTMQAQGLPLSEDQQKEFEEFQKKLFADPYISSFFKAQDSFEHILDQVNRIISESIGISQGCECGCEDEAHQHGPGCGC